MSKFSSKLIADEVPAISIYWLNQNGLLGLTDPKCPVITMENGFGNTCRVKAWIFTIGMIKLDYYISNRFEEEHIESEISLIKQKCNYGGHRLWFSCPRCHHKAGKLYLFGKYFVCRTCSDLTYLSKNMNRRSNSFILYDCMKMENNLNELVKTITKTKYRNKITKKYRSYLDLYRKLHQYDDFIEKISKYPQIYLR
ncbi:MAG: hypothetical protein ACD_37C00047G0001 [uncultured bacterium]|nr:MAG: hypothetical protein ACD_37C00047G0001 [uncultured bacterium]